MWPSKNCIDTPYIKKGSDIIYHTGKCWTLITREVELTQIREDSTKALNDWNNMISSNGYKTLKEPKVVDNTVWTMSGDGIKHYDSLWCPMCKAILPAEHVRVRIKFGFMNTNSNHSTISAKNSTVWITPLGKWVLNRPGAYLLREEIPDSLKKYFPPGYINNKKVTDYWNKLLADTQN